ncbi:hypothetical protein FisN_6Lh425 [Fistulifera solaris]|uniref:Uncharacterized protein n=1 Tax=Fistulifera solaris TaxID=1519565 RepID=A0A1Z5JLJ4_FISSO|nr:hypothetical protein FisN_6Lh425 [Fistulifera solaris]|eukprot:GAX14641.1 hypothetical protein FisN_6Lh425 [Fistulifera solaris]
MKRMRIRRRTVYNNNGRYNNIQRILVTQYKTPQPLYLPNKTITMPFALRFHCLLLLFYAAVPLSQAALVVTIGDSYAAGTGVHALREQYDDTYCYVEKDTIPGGKYASTRGMQHVVTACAGDTIDTTVAQWNDLQLRYTDEVANQWEGSVIIVSTGGNSALTRRGENFEESLARVLRTRRFHEDELNQVANLDAVQNELVDFYSQLAVDAGEATVRVMGYPLVFNSNRIKCFIPGIRVKEADFFDSTVVELNEVIVSAIEEVKTTFSNFDIRYVDVAPSYGSGACSPFKFRHIRDINVRAPVTSFHPTQRGYDRSYGAFLRTILT